MSKRKYFFNVLKHQGKETNQQPQAERHFSIKYFLSGKFLASENIRKNVPFILFISGLFIIYIYNSYRGDKKRFALEKTKRNILLLKSENIAAKTRLISATKYNEAITRASKVGLKPSTELPKKIFIPLQLEQTKENDGKRK